jgi:hypothetical protein
MKQYTDEQIEATRKAFSGNLPEERARVAGLDLSYFIMPQANCAQLPGFVYQCSNATNGVFGIADSVQPEYRPFAVYHEVVESKGNSCRKALELELAAVPSNILKEYAQMRATFFKALVGYAIEKGYEQEAIDAFKDNASKLEQLAGGKQ